MLVIKFRVIKQTSSVMVRQLDRMARSALKSPCSLTAFDHVTCNNRYNCSLFTCK